MGLAAALTAAAVLVATLWVTRADAPPPFTHIWVIMM